MNREMMLEAQDVEAEEAHVPVMLRHGIGRPTVVDLPLAEAQRISRLSVVDGIREILSRPEVSEDLRHNVRETLRDTGATIELRQGDMIRVLRRQQPLFGGGDVAIAPRPNSDLEIAISRPNHGG